MPYDESDWKTDQEHDDDHASHYFQDRVLRIDRSEGQNNAGHESIYNDAVSETANNRVFGEEPNFSARDVKESRGDENDEEMCS